MRLLDETDTTAPRYMNDELLTKALLSGRIERSVTFDSRLLYDTYQTYFAKMELNAPKMIICNFLKNRTCFSVANKSPVLIILMLSLILECSICISRCMIIYGKNKF